MKQFWFYDFSETPVRYIKNPSFDDEEIAVAMWLVNSEKLMSSVDDIFTEFCARLPNYYPHFKQISHHQEMKWLITISKKPLDYILDSKNNLYDIIKAIIKNVEFDVYVEYAVGTNLIPVMMHKANKLLDIYGKEDSVKLIKIACTGQNVTLQEFERFDNRNKTIGDYYGKR